MEKSGERTGRPPLVLDMRRAVELRAGGMSIAGVARDLGVDPGTMSRRLKEVEGVPLSALSRGKALVRGTVSSDDGARDS